MTHGIPSPRSMSLSPHNNDSSKIFHSPRHNAFHSSGSQHSKIPLSHRQSTVPSHSNTAPRSSTLTFHGSLNNQHSISKSGSSGIGIPRNSDISVLPSTPSLRQRKSINIGKFNKENKELLDQHQVALITTAARYTVLSSVAFLTSLFVTAVIGKDLYIFFILFILYINIFFTYLYSLFVFP